MRQNAIISKLWQKLNNMTYTCASRVIVLGRCMQDVVKKTLARGLEDKVELIHVWADDQNINTPTQKVNFRQKWNLEDKFILLYSGNLARFHDIESIILAAKRLQVNPTIQFVFVGEGFKKKQAKAWVDEYGLSNVHFHTYVDRSELGDLLRMADVGLVSLLESQLGLSVPSKTFGLLAASLPIIGILPAKSEISLILKEENCGFVSAPGNIDDLVQNILEIYEQNQLRHTMQKNAKRAIDEKYTLKKTAAAYKLILQSIKVTP